MRPLTVVTAIILGSSAAITFGLSAVLVIYLILRNRHPELANEFGPLLLSSAQFAVLTLVSGASFVAMVKSLRWRWIAQALMWSTMLAIGALYWPS